MDLAKYDAWRESLPLLASEASPKPTPSGSPLPAQHVVDQLMQFNLAASTPMAALNLVADLQRQWQENAQVA